VTKEPKSHAQGPERAAPLDEPIRPLRQEHTPIPAPRDEARDLAILGVIVSLGLAAVLEGAMAVLKEFLLPAIELVGGDVEFIAEIGDRGLVEQVPFDDGHLLRRRTTRLVHEKPPYRLG
jgi:hypothetical protein